VFTYRAWGSLDGMGTTPLHLGVSRNRLERYSIGRSPVSRLWTVSGWDRTVFGVAPTTYGRHTGDSRVSSSA
jgi:hypothetical protein